MTWQIWKFWHRAGRWAAKLLTKIIGVQRTQVLADGMWMECAGR